MSYISLEEFKKMPEYNKFIEENPDVGYLKIEAFTAYNAIPVSNVQIVITKPLGNDDVVIFKGTTNANGLINNIELPAPKAEYLAKEGEAPPYTRYDMNAKRAGYDNNSKYNIKMFGDVRIIQYVKMIPSAGETNNAN